MPVFAAVDRDGGGGFLAVVETPFDAAIRNAWIQHGVERSVRITWLPTMGTFGYARRVSFHFLEQGMLMQAAQRYRACVKSQGKWIGFADKAARNPNVERFVGAPAEIYVASRDSEIYTVLHEHGVRGLLAELAVSDLNPSLPDKVRPLGFILSRYDIYTDVYDSSQAKQWGKGHPWNWERNRGFRFPQDIIKNQDGSLRVGGPVIPNMYARPVLAYNSLRTLIP